MTTEDIARLISDLETAKHASFDLDCRIAEMLEPDRLAGGMLPAYYTGSLDAADNLASRIFPDRSWKMIKAGKAHLTHPEKRILDTEGECFNAASALCVAVLRAKQKGWMR